MIKSGFNTDDLRILPEFWKHMMNELSERATLELKGSSKCSWTVHVSQIEGDIHFQNGWQEFISDNSLGDFEFLVFRYERAMHFSIEIFDKTACMRDNFLENSTVANATNRPQGRPRKCKHSAAGKNIPSCQSTELKEIKEEEDDYQDNGEVEAATLPNSKFPSFTSIIGPHGYNVNLDTCSCLCLFHAPHVIKHSACIAYRYCRGMPCVILWMKPACSISHGSTQRSHKT